MYWRAWGEERVPEKFLLFCLGFIVLVFFSCGWVLTSSQEAKHLLGHIVCTPTLADIMQHVAGLWLTPQQPASQVRVGHVFCYYPWRWGDGALGHGRDKQKFCSAIPLQAHGMSGLCRPGARRPAAKLHWPRICLACCCDLILLQSHRDFTPGHWMNFQLFDCANVFFKVWHYQMQIKCIATYPCKDVQRHWTLQLPLCFCISHRIHKTGQLGLKTSNQTENCINYLSYLDGGSEFGKNFLPYLAI